MRMVGRARTWSKGKEGDEFSKRPGFMAEYGRTDIYQSELEESMGSLWSIHLDCIETIECSPMYCIALFLVFLTCNDLFKCLLCARARDTWHRPPSTPPDLSGALSEWPPVTWRTVVIKFPSRALTTSAVLGQTTSLIFREKCFRYCNAHVCNVCTTVQQFVVNVHIGVHSFDMCTLQ